MPRRANLDGSLSRPDFEELTMTRVCLVLAVLTATMFTLGGRLSAQGPTKKLTLEGDWVIIAMAKNGVIAPKEALTEAFIRATATTIVPISKSTNTEVPNSKSTYAIIGAREIDLYEFRSAAAGKDDPGILPPLKIYKPGIYEIKGDTLRISWRESIPGFKDKDGKVVVPEQKATRPEGFNGGAGEFTMVLKRRAK
jgi:hypothetical protein